MTRIAVLVGVVLCGACAARHSARTVGVGNVETSVSVGGPLFSNLGPAIPLPLLHVGARYGARDRLDVHGGVHATAAAYGVVGVDAGASYQLVRRRRGFAVAAAGLVNLLVGTREGEVRVFPELGVHADYAWSARWRGVFGADALAQHDPPPGKPPVLVAPYIGVEHRWGAGGRNGLVLQLAWISPWADSTSTIDYGPGDHGAVAIQLGYRRGGGQP